MQKILPDDSSHSFHLDKCHVDIEVKPHTACELTSSHICVIHTGLASIQHNKQKRINLIAYYSLLGCSCLSAQDWNFLVPELPWIRKDGAYYHVDKYLTTSSPRKNKALVYSVANFHIVNTFTIASSKQPT